MLEYPLDFHYGRRLDNHDYEALGVRDVWFYRDTIIMLTSFDMEINGSFKRPDHEYRYPTVYEKHSTFLFKCLKNKMLPFNDGLSDEQRDSFRKEAELEGYSADASTSINLDLACFRKNDLLTVLTDNKDMFFDVESLREFLAGSTDHRIKIYYILPNEADANTTKPTQNNFILSECKRITAKTGDVSTEAHEMFDSEPEEPNHAESLHSDLGAITSDTTSVKSKEFTPKETLPSAPTKQDLSHHETRDLTEEDTIPEEIIFPETEKSAEGEQETEEAVPEVTHESKEPNLKGNPGSQGLWGPRDKIVERAAQFMVGLVEKCDCRCRHDILAKIVYKLGNNGRSYSELDKKGYDLFGQFKAAALKIVPEERHFGKPKYTPNACKCELEDHKKFKPRK